MFTFQVSPPQVFAQRTRQFMAWGIPRPVVAKVRRRVIHMWREGHGGWCTEWSEQARRAQRQGQALLAAHCYGAARFPFACTPERQAAQRAQNRALLAAVPFLRTRLQRVELEVPFASGHTRVPVHLYEPLRRDGSALVVLSGGIDSHKVELHELATALVRLSGFSVAAIDMPGTGESRVALTPGADGVYRAAIERLRRGRKVGFWGLGFGGYWAARLAIAGAVDCAVDQGGPTGSQPDGRRLFALPGGVANIVANALGMSAPPDLRELERALEPFSLLRHLGRDPVPLPVPLLAINGADDAIIPRTDTTMFAGRRNATVVIVPGAKHCAAEALRRVVPTVAAWLTARLHPLTLRALALRGYARVASYRFEHIGGHGA